MTRFCPGFTVGSKLTVTFVFPLPISAPPSTVHEKANALLENAKVEIA